MSSILIHCSRAYITYTDKIYIPNVKVLFHIFFFSKCRELFVNPFFTINESLVRLILPFYQGYILFLYSSSLLIYERKISQP